MFGYAEQYVWSMKYELYNYTFRLMQGIVGRVGVKYSVYVSRYVFIYNYGYVCMCQCVNKSIYTHMHILNTGRGFF